MIRKFFISLILLMVIDSCGNEPKSDQDSENAQVPDAGLRVFIDPVDGSVLKSGQAITIHLESNPPLTFHKISEHPDLDCYSEKTKGRYIFEYTCRITGVHDQITLDISAKNPEEVISKQFSYIVKK